MRIDEVLPPRSVLDPFRRAQPGRDSFPTTGAEADRPRGQSHGQSARVAMERPRHEEGPAIRLSSDQNDADSRLTHRLEQSLHALATDTHCLVTEGLADTPLGSQLAPPIGHRPSSLPARSTTVSTPDSNRTQQGREACHPRSRNPMAEDRLASPKQSKLTRSASRHFHPLPEGRRTEFNLLILESENCSAIRNSNTVPMQSQRNAGFDKMSETITKRRVDGLLETRLQEVPEDRSSLRSLKREHDHRLLPESDFGTRSGTRRCPSRSPRWRHGRRPPRNDRTRRRSG
jgi:hypothetical protein